VVSSEKKSERYRVHDDQSLSGTNDDHSLSSTQSDRAQETVNEPTMRTRGRMRTYAEVGVMNINQRGHEHQLACGRSTSTLLVVHVYK